MENRSRFSMIANARPGGDRGEEHAIHSRQPFR